MGLESSGEATITSWQRSCLGRRAQGRRVACGFRRQRRGDLRDLVLDGAVGVQVRGAHPLWEELTPLPERRSLRIVDSYAGFQGDSPILEPLWTRAVAGERVEGDLPVFTSGRLWAFVDQGEEAQARAWRGEEASAAPYYAEQRADFRRLRESAPSRRTPPCRGPSPAGSAPAAPETPPGSASPARPGCSGTSRSGRRRDGGRYGVRWIRWHSALAHRLSLQFAHGFQQTRAVWGTP